MYTLGLYKRWRWKRYTEQILYIKMLQNAGKYTTFIIICFYDFISWTFEWKLVEDKMYYYGKISWNRRDWYIFTEIHIYLPYSWLSHLVVLNVSRILFQESQFEEKCYAYYGIIPHYIVYNWVNGYFQHIWR